MNKFLIVGLGNIGSDYEGTRHNIGFDVVEALVHKREGLFSSDRLAFKSEIRWKGKILICIKPTTFMNGSGKAVKYWLDKEHIDLDNMLVVVDDVAIPLSKLRLRPAGSPGGHNGLKSIEEFIQTDKYPKLRFGVGSDYPKGMQVEYVLGKWNNTELPIVKEKILTCVEMIEHFVQSGITLTMNKVNNLNFIL